MSSTILNNDQKATLKAKQPLPEGWRWVRLGEVCRVQGGFAFKSEDYCVKGIPVIRISNLIDGRVKITKDTICVSEETVANLAQFKLNEGDLLVAMSGATTGKLGVVPKSILPAYLNQRVGRFMPDPNKIDINYLYMFLSQPGYLSNIFLNAFGSAIPNVSPGFIEGLSMLLPPLPEQKRIAAILKEQMVVVEKARAATEAQLESAKVLPTAYLRAVFNSPEAQKWPRKRLDEVCTEKVGTRDPRFEPDKSFWYIDITSVNNITKRIKMPKNILGKDAPSRARQVIHADDVIVSTTRPNLNAVAVVPAELDNQICSTGFCVLRANGNLDHNYLFSFVQTSEFVHNLSDLVRGALYPAVTDKQVRSQLLPIPPLPEQQRIVETLNDQMASVERTRKVLEEQLDTINKLPDALLRRAFNGEL